MTETFASIRDDAQTIRTLITQATAGYHDAAMLRVVGDAGEVHVLAQTGGLQVMSYCSFDGLDHVEGDGEVIFPTGNDNDERGLLDYLGIAEGSGTMELRIEGEEGEIDAEHPRMGSYLSFAGALEGKIRVYSSQSDVESVPWRLPFRWTDDDRYVSRAALDDDWQITVGDDEIAEYVPPTQIVTSTDALQRRLIEPADFMDEVNYYPVTVDDGAFSVHVEGNEGDDALWGEIEAESVEGPDVDRAFDDGFKEVFGSLSGPVRLATAPDEEGASPPLVVTQSGSDRVLRHVLGPFSEV